MYCHCPVRFNHSDTFIVSYAYDDLSSSFTVTVNVHSSPHPAVFAPLSVVALYICGLVTIANESVSVFVSELG